MRAGRPDHFGHANAEPFSSAEDAWFWTCGALLARQQGVRGGESVVRRPCDPDDVILCVERLLRSGRIAPHQARVLGWWGKQGVRPSRQYGGAQDQLPWSEAMMMLEAALKKKGIVMAIGILS